MALFVMSAQKKTSLNPGARVAEAAASGTLMGFGFGEFGSAVSYKNTAQAGKALNESGLGGALIELGKTMDEGSAAYTFATELAGKKVSNADVGKLYGLITEQAQDMTPAQIFKKAIEARVSTQEAPVELTPRTNSRPRACGYEP